MNMEPLLILFQSFRSNGTSENSWQPPRLISSLYTNPRLDARGTFLVQNPTHLHLFQKKKCKRLFEEELLRTASKRRKLELPANCVSSSFLSLFISLIHSLIARSLPFWLAGSNSIRFRYGNSGSFSSFPIFRYVCLHSVHLHLTQASFMA